MGRHYRRLPTIACFVCPARPLNLSVILITCNEANRVAACLQSVAFADEWIVVDSGSDDGTREIAERFGAKVFATTDWPGFGAQKNRALALAQGRWVLSIDADERVSEELAAGIRRVIAADTTGQETHASSQKGPHAKVGYELSRLSSFCGQWMRHGDWYPDRVLRLFRRGHGRFTDDLVHERLVVDGPVGRLQGELLHESMRTLDHAIDKMNRYTTGRALDKLREGGQGGLATAIAHGVWAFLRCYMLRRGFLDGRLGFVLAFYVAEGTYYRYLKMALLQRPLNQPARTGS